MIGGYSDSFGQVRDMEALNLTDLKNSWSSRRYKCKWNTIIVNGYNPYFAIITCPINEKDLIIFNQGEDYSGTKASPDHEAWLIDTEMKTGSKLKSLSHDPYIHNLFYD